MFKDSGIRKHDKQYLRLNRYEKPLEIFKACGQFVSVRPTSEPVLDVGCAAGEFLYYLKATYPQHSYQGLDLLPELFQKANSMLGGGVKVGSVLDRSNFEGKRFDQVFMLNAHMIFDDLKSLLENLIYWCRPGGQVIIAGAFNPDPADVWIRYRLSDGPINGDLETGWNIHSIATVGRLIDGLVGVGAYEVLPFHVPIDIQKDPADFLRQRTIKDDEGRRWLVNGLSQLVQMYIVMINVPSSPDSQS
jgi:SAM-dependent methyltransferase